MDLLIPFVLKSLLIAGATLGLLRLMRERSAAERSSVAHLGIFALLLVPAASMVLPPLKVVVPLMGPAPQTSPLLDRAPTSMEIDPVATATAAPMASPLTGAELAVLAYALPAMILLFITLLALARLFALKARANVLVEPTWLSALAHAQRRMGFKHGTALLTSNELPSPISWGLMRPVILLNEEALAARGEAEAIIAHELAHVARLDWIKLLLARAATALYWFNPLVWILAREAHQLREEAADDAVLAADISDTDYAQLLVGIARHECNGLLLGAHGVAPARGSLARRVRRVLDSGSARGPVAKSFAAGVGFGAIAFAAPLAAVSFTSKAADPEMVERRTLPGVVADTVSEATLRSTQLVETALDPALDRETERAVETAVEASTEAAVNASASAAAATAAGETLPVAAVPPEPRHVVVAERPRPQVRITSSGRHVRDPVDQAITMKAVGVTPEYAAAMRASGIGPLSADDLVQLRAVGVTAQYVADMSRAGIRGATADDLTAARAVGVNGAYVAGLAAAGYSIRNIDELVELRAVGVTPQFIRKLRQAGYRPRHVDELVRLRALDFNPHDQHGPDEADEGHGE